MALVLLALLLAAAVTAFLVFIASSPKAAPPPPLRLAFTDHATQRMKERGITPGQVEAALADPTTDEPAAKGAGKDPRRVLARLVDGRILRVVVADNAATGETVVVTAFWMTLRHALPIPAERVGRVIGKEGRTIRAIEQDSGTSVRVKDGPSSVAVIEYQYVHDLEMALVRLDQEVNDVGCAKRHRESLPGAAQRSQRRPRTRPGASVLRMLRR